MDIVRVHTWQVIIFCSSAAGNGGVVEARDNGIVATLGWQVYPSLRGW
jgi:hypothetical protein